MKQKNAIARKGTNEIPEQGHYQAVGVSKADLKIKLTTKSRGFLNGGEDHKREAIKENKKENKGRHKDDLAFKQKV